MNSLISHQFEPTGAFKSHSAIGRFLGTWQRALPSIWLNTNSVRYWVKRTDFVENIFNKTILFAVFSTFEAGRGGPMLPRPGSKLGFGMAHFIYTHSFLWLNSSFMCLAKFPLLSILNWNFNVPVYQSQWTKCMMHSSHKPLLIKNTKKTTKWILN